MRIITITLNPAFDIHCNVEEFRVNRENYASDVVKHAGGKGINISRALTVYGIENTALCVLGNDGRDEFLSMLDTCGMRYGCITADGRVRENITLHSAEGETRISFEGFKVDKSVLNELMSMIRQEADGELIVTFTGRLCEGITARDAVDFLSDIKALGARLIVDCNSLSMDELLEIKPFLIKPNEYEISQLSGTEVKEIGELTDISSRLCDGGIENVIVSLGGEGSVCTDKTGSYIVKPPAITPVSTIGAGDSLIAGVVAGITEGLDKTDILRLGASFGTAACLTEGTAPPDKKTIARILSDTKTERI